MHSEKNVVKYIGGQRREKAYGNKIRGKHIWNNIGKKRKEKR